MNKKLIELALIRAIPALVIEKVPNGRLKGLYKKLILEVDRQIRYSVMPNSKELFTIGKRLELFGLMTGWSGRPKQVSTMVSFCLRVMEDSETKFRPKIFTILNDILDYFERAGKTVQSSFWAGDLAAEKWQKIVNMPDSDFF